jgi:sodium transport system permease protein
MTILTDRVRALFAMELRTLLRDRRTVVLSIVLPLAIMPLMLFASRWMEDRRQRALELRESSYAVTGPRAAEAGRLVARARAAEAGRDGSPAASLRLVERTVEDPAEALGRGTLDFYVEGLDYHVAEAQAKARRAERTPGSSGGRRASASSDTTRRRPAGEGGSPADPGRRGSRRADDTAALDVDDRDTTPPADLMAIAIVYRADRDTSQRVAQRLADRLREVRRQDRHAALEAAGFPVPAASVARVDPVNLAGEAQVAGLALGRLVTLLLLFFLLSGGAVVAQDTLAGEKERGTLETLLTTAITRREIVTAKVLLVLAVGLAITLIQVLNLLVYVGFGVIPTTQNFTAAITPGLAAGLLLLFLPLAALVAGVLVLVSGYARSYREAQLYFLPIMLLGALPALAASLPEISLRSAIVLVPIANISVGVKEMLVGRIDWLMLPVAWLVTAAAAAIAIRQTARLLSTERLIVPTAADVQLPGRPARVRAGQVAAWFAGMWAVLLVVTLNLGEDFDIRGQLFLNLVLVFLGGSLLFIRRYGLDAREVLWLRPPPAAAWIAVLIGIPAGLVTGIGIFRLSQLVVPVPREMLESFSQYMLPGHVPFWQLLPMMTILPGVCEEVAFRGVLLHTLRRHFTPVRAVLLVGLAFGLFHFSLFRILQTGYLGLLFAAATLLTRSIFPAMVWHAGSNGLAVATEELGGDMGALPSWSYGVAALGLAVSFWILWRSRRAAPPTEDPS